MKGGILLSRRKFRALHQLFEHWTNYLVRRTGFFRFDNTEPFFPAQPESIENVSGIIQIQPSDWLHQRGIVSFVRSIRSTNPNDRRILADHFARVRASQNKREGCPNDDVINCISRNVKYRRRARRVQRQTA